MDVGNLVLATLLNLTGPGHLSQGWISRIGHPLDLHLKEKNTMIMAKFGVFTGGLGHSTACTGY